MKFNYVNELESLKKEKDIKDIEKIKEMAQNGDALYQFKLGWLHVNGKITEYNFLLKMTEAGLSEQERSKAVQEYEVKEKQDFETGIELYKKAIEAGNKSAIKDLHSLYFHGSKHMDKNEEKAKDLEKEFCYIPRTGIFL